MKNAFFEAFTGLYANGSEVESIPEEIRWIYSIQSNLFHILNTRKTSVMGNPDYGIAVISDIILGERNIIQVVEEELSRAFKAGEPRIKRFVFMNWIVAIDEISCIVACTNHENRNAFFQITLSEHRSSQILLYTKEDTSSESPPETIDRF
ncbi:MAG: hypothetical protein JW795_20920 [Chitinivibrionales bacterium]|nr:hypothetical protein [Chitinivibrionales bacterium]